MRIRITFLSDWHISSGLGDSYRADAVLVRDADNFPYIPGRALKGALREGARRLGMCRKDLGYAEHFFWGSRSDTMESNTPGRLRVSAGTLPHSLKQLVAANADADNLIDDLIILRQQTAIEPDGTARDSSLRSIECGMAGLELEAEIDAEPCPEANDAWIRAYFAAVCAAVKSVGGNRSRGLGQCHISLDGAPATVALPPENPAFMGKEA